MVLRIVSAFLSSSLSSCGPCFFIVPKLYLAHPSSSNHPCSAPLLLGLRGPAHCLHELINRRRQSWGLWLQQVQLLPQGAPASAHLVWPSPLWAALVTIFSGGSSRCLPTHLKNIQLGPVLEICHELTRNIFSGWKKQTTKS